MSLRTGEFTRASAETRIEAEVTLEGKGISRIDTGIGFFDHMLELFTMHGGFDISITCDGDLEVDGHHTVEDTGIVLGKAFDKALGERKGIARYGTFFVPMDESLAMVSIDIGGRPYLYYETPNLRESWTIRYTAGRRVFQSFFQQLWHSNTCTGFVWEGYPSYA